MSADELAAVVAALGALPLPMPVVPEPLSAERLAEIAARAEAATAGPWWTDTLAEHDGSESVGIDTKGDVWIVPCQDIDHADAEFMAHARVDVPALLAEVRRQAARIAELEAARAAAEAFVPQTERSHWVAIAEALNAAHAAGMPVGIDLDGTLTDHNAWSVVWDRAADRWAVDGYEDGFPPLDAESKKTFAERAAAETDPARRTAWRMLAQGVTDGEHYRSVHHDWRLGRDLPQTGGSSVRTAREDDDPARCLKAHPFSPRDGWRMVCGNCDHGKDADCHQVGA